MKTAVWIAFFAVALSALAACGWLWVARDLVEAAFGGRRPPALTVWAFSAPAWLPFACLPWLVGAVRLTLRPVVTIDAFSIYLAACLAGCVGFGAFALVPSILPFKEVIARIPAR